MLPNKYYMHQNSMDCFILVNNVLSTSKPDMLYVESEWYNFGYTGMPWSLGQTLNFFVAKKDLHKWQPVKNIFAVRNKPGIP